MVAANNRPRLRQLDVVYVPNQEAGPAVVLRDSQGIAAAPIVVPVALARIVCRFDGTRTVEEIAGEAAREHGPSVDVALVARLVEELDDACLLDTPRARARGAALVRSFAAARVRKATHAGGAYHAEPSRLRRFIEEECLAHAPPCELAGPLVGLCSPHMDLWRAAEGYGHAYRALLDKLAPEVDTFILLGTSHAAMRRPFAVCEKEFETPLGLLEPDREILSALRGSCRFDLTADEYLHKGEHSIELQTVFLQYVLGQRSQSARIVPILCGYHSGAEGLGEESDAEWFLRALRTIVAERQGRAVVIAGADLAHVGPRFGDLEPLDARGRRALERRDQESVDLALRLDAEGFSRQVRADLDRRRVCGLSPIYTLLRVLPPARGVALHYSQCVTPNEGSVVSHASMAFVALH
jgi:AmmeMemoRadiSam system protein B